MVSNIADGYALTTSALLAIFCASLCNLPPHNGFLDHYYHGAQSGEIVFRPQVFFRTNVDVGVLVVVPRGGFRKLGRLQRSKFLSRRIKYYSNASCAFNPAVYMILCSGDVETNPGYVPECSTRPQRQGHTSKLKVFYTNARSIVNKVAKLQLELANSQADIVVLTETHLDCSISSEEVIGSDYTVYRKDRAGNRTRHGGGVLIAAKKGLITSIREHHDLPSELLFVDIITDGEKKLTIGTFYRPPNSDLKPLEDLRSCLSSITTTDLLVTGDFNLSEFDWSTSHPTKSSEHHYLLSDIIHGNFLYQMVDESTRENNILDLVLTTNSDLINNLEVGEPFSDHNSITFIVNTRPYQQRISTKENYAFNKADWNHLNRTISVQLFTLVLYFRTTGH